MLTKRRRKRVAELIQQLNAPEKKLQVRAEALLEKHYARESFDLLVQACSDEAPMKRLRAAWVLGTTGDPRASETLLRLTQDSDEAVRFDATVALGKLGDERALEPLTHMVLTDELGKAQPASIALGKMGLKAVPAIQSHFRSEIPLARLTALYLAHDLYTEGVWPEGLPILQAALVDPDAEVRG